MTVGAPLYDDFDGPDLDLTTWLPHYLPMWSSRAATRASYRLEDSCLVLDIPRDHGLWLPQDHPPLRLSGVQSGNRSGPVGSTDGQQAVFEGQLVREAQPAFTGHLQTGGHVEIRCRMTISPRSMAAFWLCGFEDEPEHSGEICVTEVFGRDVRTPGNIGVGNTVAAVKKTYGIKLGAPQNVGHGQWGRFVSYGTGGNRVWIGFLFGDALVADGPLKSTDKITLVGVSRGGGRPELMIDGC